jgi:hypothetical protein
MKREEQKAMFAHMKQAGTYSKSKNSDGASGGGTTTKVKTSNSKKFAGLGGHGARRGSQTGQTSLF